MAPAATPRAAGSRQGRAMARCANCPGVSSSRPGASQAVLLAELRREGAGAGSPVEAPDAPPRPRRKPGRIEWTISGGPNSRGMAPTPRDPWRQFLSRLG